MRQPLVNFIGIYLPFTTSKMSDAFSETSSRQITNEITNTFKTMKNILIHCKCATIDKKRPLHRSQIALRDRGATIIRPVVRKSVFNTPIFFRMCGAVPCANWFCSRTFGLLANGLVHHRFANQASKFMATVTAKQFGFIIEGNEFWLVLIILIDCEFPSPIGQSSIHLCRDRCAKHFSGSCSKSSSAGASGEWKKV